jgi:hypothetical protein
VRRFLHFETIGKPQFVAAVLLFVYLAQCLWLIEIQARLDSRPNPALALRIRDGLAQWRGGPVAGTPESLPAEAATGLPSAARARHQRVRDGFDEDRSPLYSLTAAAPFILRPAAWTAGSTLWHVIAAAPYLFFGIMLGGSLWYVTRRLYGNASGYVALLLYCFSPAMIVNVAGSQSFGEVGAVWGAFGAIWTGIAVAHTLYAPREVVLWNWRRIILLGLSLALAIGNQFSLAIIAIVALLLMLWVAPVRKGAVLVIWGAACAVAGFLLLSAYFFKLNLIRKAIAHARWIDSDWHALVSWVSWRHALETVFAGSPALMLALPAALITFMAWKRARYFGNAVPLLIAVLLLILASAAPLFPGEGFHLAALIFLFIFVTGVFADLLESRHGLLVMASLCGLLIASAAWNLLQLARLGHG